MPECIYFQPETKESVAHSSAPITIFRYGNQISLFSTSTGLSKHRHKRARVVTPIVKQHKQKAILIKATSLNTGSILLFLSLCSKCIQTLFPLSLALTCPVVSRLCVRPIVARTSVGVQRASASRERRRSTMENMSIICKQQQILHINTLAEAEKSVSVQLNGYQNICFVHSWTCLILLEIWTCSILVNKWQKRWNYKCHCCSLIKEHTDAHTLAQPAF